jgi:hypothetical protein
MYRIKEAVTNLPKSTRSRLQNGRLLPLAQLLQAALPSRGKALTIFLQC